MNDITLCSSGLTSKYGFEDGDIFDDAIYDAGIDACQRGDGDHLFLGQEVLARIVESRLIPRVEEVIERALPVTRISSCHNPIRADGFDHYSGLTVHPAGRPISITVSKSDIVKIALEVARERGTKPGITPAGASGLSADDGDSRHLSHGDHT